MRSIVILIRMTKQFGEQRVTHPNGFGLFDAILHPFDVFLDLCGDFRIVRFRQRFDAIGKFLHVTIDLSVIAQQELKHGMIFVMTFILAATTPAAPSTLTWPALLVGAKASTRASSRSGLCFDDSTDEYGADKSRDQGHARIFMGASPVLIVAMYGSHRSD